MISLIIHIANQDPVKVDVDEIPGPTDTCIIGRNPRERSDKELPWIDEGVTTIIVPWWRINYVQVLPTGEEQTEFPLLFRE